MDKLINIVATTLVGSDTHIIMIFSPYSGHVKMSEIVHLIRYISSENNKVILIQLLLRNVENLSGSNLIELLQLISDDKYKIMIIQIAMQYLKNYDSDLCPAILRLFSKDDDKLIVIQMMSNIDMKLSKLQHFLNIILLLNVDTTKVITLQILISKNKQVLQALDLHPLLNLLSDGSCKLNTIALCSGKLSGQFKYLDLIRITDHFHEKTDKISVIILLSQYVKIIINEELKDACDKLYNITNSETSSDFEFFEYVCSVLDIDNHHVKQYQQEKEQQLSYIKNNQSKQPIKIGKSLTFDGKGFAIETDNMINGNILIKKYLVNQSTKATMEGLNVNIENINGTNYKVTTKNYSDGSYEISKEIMNNTKQSISVSCYEFSFQ